MATKTNYVYIPLSADPKQVEKDINNTILDICKNHSVQIIYLDTLEFFDNSKVPIVYAEDTEGEHTLPWPEYTEYEEDLFKRLQTFVKCIGLSTDTKTNVDNIKKCLETTLKPYKINDIDYSGIQCYISRIQDIIILTFVKNIVTISFDVSYVSIPSDAKEASEYMTKISNYDGFNNTDIVNNSIRDNNNSIISILSKRR